MTGATAPTLERFGCAPAQLLAVACREIARLHAADAADLTRFTVVIPDLHALPATARGLQAAFGQSVLLLPRIVTLRSWAGEIALEQDVITATAQESGLYRLLTDRRWLAGADLWAVATELTILFAELTRWQVALPATERELKTQLDAAYRARAGASFGFEARLIHELWHASHTGAAIDAESAYVRQLAMLASQVNGPVYVLRLAPFAPAEEAFLQRCAQRVTVRVFDADHSIAVEPLERLIAHVWPQPPRVDLASRAQALRTALLQSPLNGKLRFFAAASAESHAQAVDIAIRRWLIEGRKTIAVIVLDRIAARRARALLERAAILVRDEAGWALSTTSAATVIGRWLDTLASDYAYDVCLDLLKSPFIFHDAPRAARQEAVWRLEQAIRRTSVRSGIMRYLRLAESDDELQKLLGRVVRAERAIGRNRRKTIRGWLQALEESLVELGVHAGLAADVAGIELLALLETLRTELETDALRLSFSEWRRWLARKIETATFRDRSIESPVIFTTLEATRLRQFDAVLLLGADASHLPGPEPTSPFFNQSVRRELGLPLRADELRTLEQRLGTLIGSCGDMLITWQRTVEGEENLLSPLLERLLAIHEHAWGSRLEDTDLADARAAPVFDGSTGRFAEQRVPPAARIPPPLLPASISASGYNALMACPYRFFARYALKLAEADEVREEIEKSDYGERVHAILKEFHQAYPLVSALDSRKAEQMLSALSERSFQDLIDHDYQSAGWLARWLALVPDYIDWQRKREGQGWRFSSGESDRSITIETPSGRTFLLRGRIDRVDEATHGAALVDYKTSAPRRLGRALETAGEDVQLPVYALLWGGEVAAALFLSIDRDGVVPVALRGDITTLAEATRARLADLYDAVAEGAALPAQGTDEVCQHCEYQGLCRKKYWCE